MQGAGLSWAFVENALAQFLGCFGCQLAGLFAR